MLTDCISNYNLEQEPQFEELSKINTEKDIFILLILNLQFYNYYNINSLPMSLFLYIETKSH